MADIDGTNPGEELNGDPDDNILYGNSPSDDTMFRAGLEHN